MNRSLVAFALVGTAAALLLGGCGRKGPLEPPPSAQLAQPANVAQPAPAQLGQPTGTQQPPKPKPAMDAHGHPIAPPGPKTHIFLDNLID